MPGLLGGVLPALYSAGDRAKRQIRSLLSDPVGYVQQTAGQLQDNARQYEALQAQAFADPKRPLKVTDRQALGELTNQTLGGLLGMAPVGMTVWHGSPHKFDKFDSSKIGTGEGAQAYGHGLYLAENPVTAQSYRDTLSGNKVELKPGASVYDKNLVDIINKEIGQGRTLNEIKALNAQYADVAPDSIMGQMHRAIANDELAPSGSLYKVDLPDEHIAKMLDWDKPLSQQSKEVQTSAMNIAGDHMGRLAKTQAAYMPGIKPLDTLTGEEFHRYLSNNDGFLGIQPGAILSGAPGWTNMIVADRLKQQGIPGIRYLDGGSRGVPQQSFKIVSKAGGFESPLVDDLSRAQSMLSGYQKNAFPDAQIVPVGNKLSSNFVIFPGNEGLLTIIERNGVPIK